MARALEALTEAEQKKPALPQLRMARASVLRDLGDYAAALQTLLPLLKEGGKARKSGASIVNFSSVGGLRGAAFNAAYCTSKAAVKMLSKCLGAEFAALGYNIRCNSVHPGGIDTAMLNGIIDRYVELGAVPSAEVARDAMIAQHPIGRLGRPDEMAGGVVYLCSDAASFVTCSEFLMDGGFSQV